MTQVVEEAFKVIVVGDGNVGKTSLLRRFVRGDFVEQYRRTIGAEFLEKDVYVPPYAATVRLMLWDTAGQEMFNALTQAYYRGAGAAVIAFSTVDRASFEHVVAWKGRVEHVCGPITMVLCQTKMDLAHETAMAAVSRDEAEQLAEQLHIPFFRVSTKDDFNVTQLFEFVAEQCLVALDTAANTKATAVHEMVGTGSTSAAMPGATAKADDGAAHTRAHALPPPPPPPLSQASPQNNAAAPGSSLQQQHQSSSVPPPPPPTAAAVHAVAASPPQHMTPAMTSAASSSVTAGSGTTLAAAAASPIPTTLTLPVVLPTPVAMPVTLPNDAAAAAAAGAAPAPSKTAATPSQQRRVRLQDAKSPRKRKHKRHMKCSIV